MALAYRRVGLLSLQQLLVALHFVYYNICRRHQTLVMTPAIAAGLEDHEWSIEELVGLLEAREATDGIQTW